MKTNGSTGRNIELLAPGGSLEAALAGLSAGADAVYVGLERFSARADARNLSPRDLEELCAWARPRGKRVYATVNTLVRDAEFAGPDGVCAALETCAAAGVDAIIVQDAGVARVARRCFPELRLHASTQMAVHNLEGARAAADAGFARVTLARELGLDEIREIARGFRGEVECFAQGALCYAYSGLCLYSAILRGRSGNRGACAYPCREAFRAADGSEALCFSMMDLGAAALAADFAAAGVASLKIEGRKKSPVYVGAAVRLWRGILDGTLSGAALREAERELKTVFSRPWTELHLRARRGVAVIDPETTGHRGVPVGRVEAAGRGWLQFRPTLPIEAHDGLQVELPGETRPFGFAVEGLVTRDGRDVFRVDSGTDVQIDVPANAPRIPVGTRLYLSSSQALKRKYRVDLPNPKDFRRRLPLRVVAAPGPDGTVAVRATAADGSATFSAESVLPGPLPAPRNPDAMRRALAEAFGKVGETPFVLESLDWPDPPFLPVSRLNALRRELADALQAQWLAWRAARVEEAARFAETAPALPPPLAAAPALVVKTDQPDALREALSGTAGDLRLGEVVVEWSPALREDALEALRAALPASIPLRRAIPAVVRAWDRPALRSWIRDALDRGDALWEIANPGGLGLLRELAPDAPALDVSADWPLYVWNRAAAAEWASRGITRFTLSPEDSTDNARVLADAFPNRLVWVVHRDPPLFLSENCPQAARAGVCPGPSRCHYQGETLSNRAGETVQVVNRNCRFATLLAEPVVLPPPPGLPVIPRADFLWRPWPPDALRHALFHVI